MISRRSTSTSLSFLSLVFGVITVAMLSEERAVGEMLAIPNASFESPPTVFVDTHIDSWEETPKPAWYDESDGYTWDQLSGVFLNTPISSSDHIDNCHGNQAMYLFAVPEVGVFQDYECKDWLHVTPNHEFNARFEVGKGYRLTVGVIGGGGGMLPGAGLELSFYYRDALSNRMSVAATNILHDTSVFSNTTHLVDCHLDLRTVRATDPWAGMFLGIQIRSTVSDAQAGGYWDIDHVRLKAIPAPLLSEAEFAGNQFKFKVVSEAGGRVEILSAENANAETWTSAGVVTNVSGSIWVTNTVTGIGPHRFYRALALP